MKSKILSLLKVSFINTYRFNKIKNAPLKRKILYLILAIYIGISLIFTMFSYASMAIDYFTKFDMEYLVIPLFATGSFMIDVIFNMYGAKNTLFDCKDNDLLLSMPIKSSTILASRIIKLYIMNFLITSLMFIPMIVKYVSVVPVNISFYPIMVLIILLLPIVPTIISSLLGYFIAFISTKTKFKNLVEFIIPILFAAGIMYFSMNAEKLLSSLITNVEVYTNIIKYAIFPIYAINQVILSKKYIYLLYLIIFSVIVFGLFILILKSSYFKIISNLTKVNSKSNYHLTKLNSKSVDKALLFKELKRYFSSPIYISNTCFGILFLLVIAIVTIFSKDLIFGSLIQFGNNIKPFEIITILIVAVCFMDNTASCSISLEGNNFWIIKSLPIEVKKVFNAKVLVNVLVIAPLTIISIIILSFTMGITITNTLLLILLTIILSFFTGYFGVIANLLLPKLTFNNDTEIVKQSLSTLLGIMAPMFLMILIIGLYLGLKVNYYTFLIIIMVVFTILIFIMRKILSTWGEKRFSEI